MEKLVIVLSFLVSSQIFAQDTFRIRPAHFHTSRTSLYCKDGTPFIQVSGNTTRCYQPGQAYISKYEVLEINYSYTEDILGRMRVTGAEGKIQVEANDLGYRYNCDNPRGMPYFKSVELPIIPGSWTVIIHDKEYKLVKGYKTCSVQIEN